MHPRDRSDGQLAGHVADVVVGIYSAAAARVIGSGGACARGGCGAGRDRGQAGDGVGGDEAGVGGADGRDGIAQGDRRAVGGDDQRNGGDDQRAGHEYEGVVDRRESPCRGRDGVGPNRAHRPCRGREARGAGYDRDRIGADEAGDSVGQSRIGRAIGLGLVLGGDSEDGRGDDQATLDVADVVLGIDRTRAGRVIAADRACARGGRGADRSRGQARRGVAVDEAAV